MTAPSVCQEELPLLQTISGCHLYSTCLKKGDGYGASPSPPWEAGLSEEHRTWSSSRSGSHAFSFLGLLSAALVVLAGNSLCVEQLHKAARTHESEYTGALTPIPAAFT